MRPEAGMLRSIDGQGEAGTHVVTFHKVGMADVDAVQIFFATYLVWVGTSYEKLCAELEHPIETLIAAGQTQPVVHVDAHFESPVGLGALVRQETRIVRVGRSSMVLRDDFFEGSRRLAVVESVRAWVQAAPEQQTIEVPAWIRSAVRADPDSPR